MRHSTSNEIFLARSHWYAFPIDDQCVASLHNNHVFVAIVGVRCGFSCVAAGPKRHLTAILSAKNITLYSRGRLMGPCYSVCRMFHELGKVVHNAQCHTLADGGANVHCIGRISLLRRRIFGELPRGIPVTRVEVAQNPVTGTRRQCRTATCPDSRLRPSDRKG